MRSLIIIGASGHGKVCADVARLNGYEKIYFLDDDENIKECAGYEVIGTVEDLNKICGCSLFFIAIGNAEIRKKITNNIRMQKGEVITLIHPKSVIADDTVIGTGSVIMAGTVINSGTTIGEGCIINTSSSVDHDCKVGNFVHIAVGAHIAGTVEIGEGTWIGAGATIRNNLKICNDCMIGVGAVVVNTITEAGTYFGVPAKMKE